MKKDRDFVSKKRAREREVIVRRGAKSRTLEDSRHSSGRCTDRAKVIPAWCATVLHTANGVGNSLELAVPGISALLLARYPSPRDKDVTASWRPTIPSPPPSAFPVRFGPMEMGFELVSRSRLFFYRGTMGDGNDFARSLGNC